MAEPLKTIVIADDEPTVAHVLSSLATSLGYQCLAVAQNGAEAVDAVRRLKPNLILLDMHMPVLDGMEATKQIVAMGTTAVVMLTGDLDPALALKAMDLGASSFMNKPFDSAQIAGIMESAWHRFQSFMTLQQKAQALDEALELRKLVEKAKGILMEQQRFSEDEAHKCLLKMSQDQGLPLKDICRSVIQIRMVLSKPSASRKSAFGR